jgi:hypothetical protein
MHTRALALGIITAASLSFGGVACQHEETSGAEAQLQAASAPGAHACPMGVTGVKVTAIDVATGVALDFETSAGPNEVGDLQRRVHAMSDAGTLGMMRGPGAGGGRAGRAASRQTSGAARPRVRVEDTARGARVTLEPLEAQGAEGLDALRARVRAHAQRMASNDACVRARTSR